MISDAFKGGDVLDSWRNINWQILSRRKKFIKIEITTTQTSFVTFKASLKCQNETIVKMMFDFGTPSRRL